jgi:hypothetical protein
MSQIVTHSAWANALTDEQLQALHLWVGNGRVVNARLRAGGELGCEMRVRQMEALMQAVVAIEPGTVLWRGQNVPHLQGWRERIMLCTSLDRQVAARFARDAAACFDRGRYRSKSLLRIVVGEGVLGLPLYAADLGPCARGEAEVVLLPSRLDVVAEHTDYLDVVARRSWMLDPH